MSHPVQILELQLTIQYPIRGEALGLTLSAGPVAAAHGDFFNTWKQSRLEDEVRTCIRVKANCTIG